MALPAALSRPPQTAKREAFEALRERLRSSDMSPAAPRLPSAIPDLDRALGGGFPRGTLATLEGAQSSGRWAIVARLLAQATRRGLGAIVDAGALYPPDLVAAGVALERLLIVPAATPLIVAPSLRATMWRRLAGLARKSGALLLVVATQPSPELQAAAGVRVRCERNRGVTCLR